MRTQLGVIRNRPGYRFAYNQQQLDAAVHRADPLRHLGRHEVAGTLLDGDLALEGVWHLPPVPFEAFAVVVVTVKEMHLAGRLLYLRMQEQHLQQRPCAAFAYADYDRLGQMAIRARKVDLVGEEKGRRRAYLPSIRI